MWLFLREFVYAQLLVLRWHVHLIQCERSKRSPNMMLLNQAVEAQKRLHVLIRQRIDSLFELFGLPSDYDWKDHVPPPMWDGKEKEEKDD